MTETENKLIQLAAKLLIETAELQQKDGLYEFTLKGKSSFVKAWHELFEVVDGLGGFE